MSSTYTRSHKPHHNAIYTLFAVSAVFIITLFPNAIVSIIVYTENVITGTSRNYCILAQVNVPCKVLRLVNYSANFILYGVTGRRFREQLINMWHNKVVKFLCPKYFDPLVKENILMREMRQTPEGT